VPELDTKITKTRILQESRNMAKVRKAGVNTPALYFLDQENRRIYMEYFADPVITVKDFLLGAGNLGKHSTDSLEILGS
jgi:TP53 regulating kinase-like protein